MLAIPLLILFGVVIVIVAMRSSKRREERRVARQEFVARGKMREVTTRAERRERWDQLVTTDYFASGADGVRWMAIDDEQSHQAIAITLVEHAWTHSEPDGGDGGLDQRCVLRAIDQVKARAILTPAVRTWLTNMPHKSGCLLSDRGITLYTRGHCSPRELGDLAQRVRELVRMIASGGATN